MVNTKLERKTAPWFEPRCSAKGCHGRRLHTIGSTGYRGKTHPPIHLCETAVRIVVEMLPSLVQLPPFRPRVFQPTLHSAELVYEGG